MSRFLEASARARRLVVAAWCLAGPATALAQVAAPATTPAADATPALGPGFVQALAGLALVLALIFGAGWVLKRLQPASAGRGRAGAIRVIASQALGARERVVMIEVGGRWLLLGVAPGQVNRLASLPKGEDDAPAATPAFAPWLARALGRPVDGRK